MCGITGLATLGEAPEERTIRAMCATILHRGPDGEGVFVGDGVGLGMRRLAIIDLVTGDQPMSNQSGTVQTVFNGEIYNYRELRDNLCKKGYEFRTSSDTEVIPHLYDEYGIDFITMLNGIFAIALWDAEKQTLLLTRDRFGIKPLFFTVSKSRIIFGSEVKPILCADRSSRDINFEGLDQFLTFEYTVSPCTLIGGIEKLPPAGWLTWARGERQQGSYWQLPGPEQQLHVADQEATENVYQLVQDAVKRQMISDVPLGAFLSGGIDSSIVVSAMARQSTIPVKTFSIGFADQSYNELAYARAVARKWNTEHHEEVLEPSYETLIPEIIEHMDQPIADFSVFPTLLVSRVAREHVTVVLGGDGGDELFAGYDTYVADRYARHSTDFLPMPLRRFLLTLVDQLSLSSDKRGLINTLTRYLEGARLKSGLSHMRWMLFTTDTQKRQLYTRDFYEQVVGEAEHTAMNFLENGISDYVQNSTYCDVRLYLSENILPKVDLMSMACSLEARVPYLDNELAEYALRLPSSLKWRKGIQKHILKEAFALDLPEVVRGRGKEGFSIPMKNWLINEWNGMMHDILRPTVIQRDGIFRVDAINRLVEEHEQERKNHSHLLWALMVFHLWKDRFITVTNG